MRKPGIRPPETLNYKEEAPQDLPPFALHVPWVRNLLHPLVVGVMVACIAWAVVQCVRLWAPAWSGTYFMLAPILAALAGHYTYRLDKRKYISGMEQLRHKALEVGVMFLLLKIATHLDDTVAEMMAYFQAWQAEPLSFFDGQTLAAFGLSFFAWFAAGATARDLDAIADPYLRLEQGGAGPEQRIAQRFFIGGIVLLLFAGLARVGLAALLRMDRPPVPGLILNVLIYFVLGLTLLGQVHFAKLLRLWQRQQIAVSPELAGRWARYTLIFLAVALVVAFLLPTGYTLSLLDMAAFVLSLLFYFVLLLWFLISLPVTWLLSLLLGNQMVGTPSLPRPELAPPPLAMATGGGAWWQVLRALFFWGVLLASVYMVVRGYLRDRPELWASIRNFRPVQFLRALWAALRQIWRKLEAGVRRTLPRVADLWRREVGPSARQGLFRRRGRSARERVFYFYLSLLDRAGERGFPRSRTQTPYEYQSALTPQLDDVQEESVTETFSALTEAFVEARYSHHPVTDAQAQRLEVEWSQLQAAVARLGEEMEVDSGG